MTVGTTTHVSIAGHEYIVRPGSYVRRQAPQFGARFTTGDPDLNNLSFWQHWSQRCLVGGVDQDLFADDAMYDQGVGIDTTTHERVTLGRGLSRGTGANWTISSGTANATNGFQSVIYNNVLYVVTIPAFGSIGHLWRYDPTLDGWVRITALDSANISTTCIGTFDGKLWVGGSTVGSTTGKLVYSSGALSSWNLMANPSGLDTLSTVTAIRTFQERLYVSFSAQIWRIKNDITWDGNVVFYKVNMNSQSNGITSMETHLGFLYMLSYNGHVHRTDGNSTFDIWSWDGQTEGVSIKSFDGRLFILTFEYTNTADVGTGVLYQMSGSAVTQLKRWGHESDATRIGSMTVYDRKMFYGASNLLGFGDREGFGVAVYDPIEDAHSIVVSNSDNTTYLPGPAPYRNYIVDDQTFYEGKMFVFVRGYGAFQTPYRNRDDVTGVRRYDISESGASIASLAGGWFTTSTYDAGSPGLRKLWRRITIDATIYANTSIVVDYSNDDGNTWVSLPAITTVQARGRTEYFLENVSATSLKLRFTLRSTNAQYSPVLFGFLVAYVPTPEPNWLWSMTLVLAREIEAADKTLPNLTYDTEAEVTFLETQHRARQLVAFTDIDGTQWASGGEPGVLIYDIEFRFRDLVQPLECEVVISLLEAVEAY